jgi:hypothetical protein
MDIRGPLDEIPELAKQKRRDLKNEMDFVDCFLSQSGTGDDKRSVRQSSCASWPRLLGSGEWLVGGSYLTCLMITSRNTRPLPRLK